MPTAQQQGTGLRPPHILLTCSCTDAHHAGWTIMDGSALAAPPLFRPSYSRNRMPHEHGWRSMRLQQPASAFASRRSAQAATHSVALPLPGSSTVPACCQLQRCFQTIWQVVPSNSSPEAESAAAAAAAHWLQCCCWASQHSPWPPGQCGTAVVDTCCGVIAAALK
jgi:hypothetical protein